MRIGESITVAFRSAKVAAFAERKATKSEVIASLILNPYSWRLRNAGRSSAWRQSPNMLGALLSILTAEKLGVEVKPDKKG